MITGTQHPAPLLLALLTAGCAGTPMMRLDLASDPSGASVSISRRGEKAYQGSFGPVKGDVDADRFEEAFRSIGTTPLEYSSPLRDTLKDATVLGVGGREILRFEEAIVRFEKPGYETVEKYVRFERGRRSLSAVLHEADGG